MKKYTYLAFIFLFIIACEKDEETPRIEPQFKTIEKYFYIADFNYAKKYRGYYEDYIYKEVYLFDTNDNMVEIQYHFGNENYIEKTVYEYENGVLVNIVDYDRNGEQKDIFYEIINNEFGQIKEQIIYLPIVSGYSTYKTLYSYFPNGNVKSESMYFCNQEVCSFDYTINYEYDEEGNLIKENIGDSDYCIYFYPEYDEYGNWIVQNRHIYKDLTGHSYEVVEREIEYY